MIATLVLQECRLIVTVTRGRLPPPSASTTQRGTSSPLIGSGGSGGSTSVRNFISGLLSGQNTFVIVRFVTSTDRRTS
jgi:hypothetical protein